jgi:hypothetical protein
VPPTSHFLKIHIIIIIVPSTSGSPKWSLSLRFHHQNPLTKRRVYENTCINVGTRLIFKNFWANFHLYPNGHTQPSFGATFV